MTLHQSLALMAPSSQGVDVYIFGALRGTNRSIRMFPKP